MNKITILLFLICFPISSYGFSFGVRGEYIPIDSLSQQDAGRVVMLDIRDRKIDFPIDGRTITFVQEIELDSTAEFIVGSWGQTLFSRFENGDVIALNVSELLQVESDSIFISASFQEFNERGRSIGRAVQVESLAVCKSELLGVMLLPTPTEIRRGQRAVNWFIGILCAIVVVPVIILALTSN